MTTASPQRSRIVNDPPTAFAHDPLCSAHGSPQWSDVDECGPCDYLARVRAESVPSPFGGNRYPLIIEEKS